MYYGQPYGAYGDPDKHIKIIETQTTTGGARVRIEASTGLGDAYYQVYVNNTFAGAIWCPEGSFSEWLNVIITGAGDASIVAFRVGAQPSFDNSFYASLSEEEPQTVTASWAWDYEVLGTPDLDTLTNWSVSGINRENITIEAQNTRGSEIASVNVSGGIATVSIGSLASGSGAVGTTVTLSAINNSGVSGTVDVDALATTETGSIIFRWPKYMRILRNQTTPPTTIISTVAYNGSDTGSYTDPSTLEVGTYYYAFQAISDTDDIGDQSSPQTIVVTGAPDSPNNLEYVSGNALATVVSWEASDTVGASYNIYIANPDDLYLDTETPAATAIAGSTGATLPAITGYPGTAQILVRALYSGVEELNGDILFIEYDAAGDYVEGRPNTPSITSVSVSTGLTINVQGSYNPSNEAGDATKLQLFVRDTDGVYDFNTPSDTSALGVERNGFKTATLSDTLTVGWYYITVKSVTDLGTQSVESATEVLIYVSDVNAVAPTGTFTLTRG